MWDIVFSIGDQINDLMGRYDRQTWVYIFVGVFVLGLLCMRGFGSRSNNAAEMGDGSSALGPNGVAFT